MPMIKEGDMVMTNSELLQILELRFEENPHRHKLLHWKDVLKRLESDDEKLMSLVKMH